MTEDKAQNRTQKTVKLEKDIQTDPMILTAAIETLNTEVVDADKKLNYLNCFGAKVAGA